MWGCARDGDNIWFPVCAGEKHVRLNETIRFLAMMGSAPRFAITPGICGWGGTPVFLDVGMRGDFLIVIELGIRIRCWDVDICNGCCGCIISIKLITAVRVTVIIRGRCVGRITTVTDYTVAAIGCRVGILLLFVI